MLLTNLNSMSIEELWSLHEQLDSVLASKLSAEKAELEKKLGQRKTPRTMRDVLTLRSFQSFEHARLRRSAAPSADAGRPHKPGCCKRGGCDEKRRFQPRQFPIATHLRLFVWTVPEQHVFDRLTIS